MIIRRPAFRLAAVTAAATLVLTACNGGGDEVDVDPDPDGPDQTLGEPGEGGEETGEPGASGGEFTIYNCEPQNLQTGSSSEVCGSKVLEQLYSGLTSIDYDSGEVVGVVASDWETEDAQNWTFTLRDDFTFHNGDPVTAQTFVDTWNWIVNPDNGQTQEAFFDKIEGYQEVADGEATEMSGLSAPDDTTLEITLSEPFSPFPAQLSYTAFYPLPEVAFEDIAAFQEAPIGNGRYQMDGEWVHNVEIAMTRYEDWPGDEPGLADRVVWKIYSDVNTAYLDVQAGSLDILDGIPPERLATVDQEFPDQYQEDQTSSFTYLGFPLYQEEFQDPDIRHALSMAIDRQTIIDTIFNGAREPATGVIPPVLPEYRGDACNYCDFDAETARQMYEDAGGPSELTIYFNSGAGHEEWTEAVANMWQQNLPIDSISFESLEFAQYLDLHDEEVITGPYRLGWVLSYPSPQYAMEPLYSTGADSNYARYSNEEFDNLIDQANAEADEDAAAELYQQAEDILLEDMPVIPMWYETRTTVHSTNVDNIVVDPRTFVRVEQVEVTSG